MDMPDRINSQFGHEYRIAGEYGNEITLNRNFPANGRHKHSYHLKGNKSGADYHTGQGSLFSITLTSEDFLDLFNAFLDMEKEYEDGEF